MKLSQFSFDTAVLVGRAILPAAAFQAALSARSENYARGHRRLKTGGSQDRLPRFHDTSICVYRRQYR